MEKLFSYGTLQQKNVQMETFGRELVGEQDVLLGYRLAMVKIKDAQVIQTSGTDLHPILQFTGNSSDQVKGSVFDISHEELLQADKYETKDYQRVSAKLKSGKTTWVFVASES